MVERGRGSIPAEFSLSGSGWRRSLGHPARPWCCPAFLLLSDLGTRRLQLPSIHLRSKLSGLEQYGLRLPDIHLLPLLSIVSQLHGLLGIPPSYRTSASRRSESASHNLDEAI